MTELDPKAIRASFASLKLTRKRLAAIFYDLLLDRYPRLRPIFSVDDSAMQQERFLHGLELVLSKLDEPDSLSPYLESLGRLHAAKGLETAHYDAIGECLLAALEELYGERWSDDLETAWTEAYLLISHQMLNGATSQGSSEVATSRFAAAF